MTSLDLKKLKVELLQVQAARASLELRVEERLEEIDRIREHIAVSLAKEADLAEKIKTNEK
jgi:DNA-binding protein H-NS